MSGSLKLLGETKSRLDENQGDIDKALDHLNTLLAERTRLQAIHKSVASECLARTSEDRSHCEEDKRCKWGRYKNNRPYCAVSSEYSKPFENADYKYGAELVKFGQHYGKEKLDRNKLQEAEVWSEPEGMETLRQLGYL